MSREHIKQLQKRAQRLLQLSSEEESVDDFNAVTVTDRYQPSQEREFVQAASNSTNIKGWSSPEDEVTEGQYHGTDLELLKRCLYLANENNILKREIDRGMIENEELRKQVAHLATELAKLSEERTRETAEMEAKLKYRSEERGNDLLKVDQIRLTNDQLQKNSHELLKMQNQQLLRRVDLLNRRLSSDAQSHNKQHEQQLKSMAVHASNKCRRLERELREQRGKTMRLCKFLNGEIPALKDTLVEVSAKLDAKLQKYLVRDMGFSWDI